MFDKMTPVDASDDSHFCVPVNSLSTAQFAYYAAKVLELLTRVPPPV